MVLVAADMTQKLAYMQITSTSDEYIYMYVCVC